MWVFVWADRMAAMMAASRAVCLAVPRVVSSVESLD